jgi:hypothetical protein
MHLPEPAELRDLIALRRAQEGEPVPASAVRRRWTFHLCDGTQPVLAVEWLEADTTAPDGGAAAPDGAAAGGGPVAPSSAAALGGPVPPGSPVVRGGAGGPVGEAGLGIIAARVRDGACAVFAVDAAHLAVPLDPGRAAAVGAATGAHRADTVVQAAATFHRDRNSTPPLVLILLTGAEQLIRDGRQLRTREGLLADLRLLLPSAFGPGVLAALCPVSATGGEAGRPVGTEPLAWVLLLDLLRREAARLRQLAAAEGAEAVRLRQQAEERRTNTSWWNPARLLSYRDDHRAGRGEDRAQQAWTGASANREVETILHRDLRDTTVLLGGEPYTG